MSETNVYTEKQKETLCEFCITVEYLYSLQSKMSDYDMILIWSSSSHVLISYSGLYFLMKMK